ncbi:MAG: O-antigen ligase family protein [Phycisphaerales bacterium]|nr:MAG: O-antigen ligase family protein [Phycisphaerales bacterium]
MSPERPGSDNRPGQARSYVPGVLRWISALGIAAVAVMRCVIFFAPQVVFDLDPALDPYPLAGLGPAGSLWLDVILMISAACGFAGEALSKRGIDWLLLLLACLPLPVVLWHGYGDGGDLWLGSTWLAAAMACATVAHLARDRALRIVFLALLAAVIIPLLVRGAANVTYEHEDTLQQYEQNKAQFLAEKGWEPDSPNALIYERRMQHREPRGWFGSTNIFGALAAFSVILWLGIGLAAIRAGLTGGWAGLAGLIVIASAAGLWMTGSMGALVAGFGGLVLLLAGWKIAFVRAIMKRFGPGIAVLCVLGALVAVAVRGAALPEGFAGERSLLYRWHYLASSAEIIAEDPLTGVGPDSYQVAYMKHRLPRNPEEVASAHSMFFDWLCTVGLVAVAWIALVLIQTWRAGKGLRFGSEPEEERPPGSRTGLVAVVVVCGLGLIPAILFEADVLDALSFFLRSVGVMGFAAAALAIGYILVRVDHRLVEAALAAGAIALLVHGQIEMTFTRPGSVVWAMCVLGLAGGARAAGRKPAGWIGAAVALFGAVWIAFTAAIPASRQQSLMIEAAEILEPVAEENSALSAADQIALRTQAAETLDAAHRAWPIDRTPLFAAGEQLERASRIERGNERIALLREAMERLQMCIDLDRSAEAMNLAFFVQLKLGELTGDDAYNEAAVDLARAMAELDPNGLAPWRRLGDVLWQLGRTKEAIAAYQRALEANANFELDPLKQLPEGDRIEIERRVAEAGGQ